MILNRNDSIKISRIFNNLPLIGSFGKYGEGVQIEKIANTREE